MPALQGLLLERSRRAPLLVEQSQEKARRKRLKLVKIGEEVLFLPERLFITTMNTEYSAGADPHRSGRDDRKCCATLL
jgi:hypothetical protein